MWESFERSFRTAPECSSPLSYRMTYRALHSSKNSGPAWANLRGPKREEKVKRKESAGTNALYTYLIGRTADLQKTLTAEHPDPIEDHSEIQIIAEGGLAALVSPVSLDSYGEGRFEE